MKKLFLLLFFTFYFLHFTLKAQDRHLIDSLQNEIKNFDAHKKELWSKATQLMDSAKVKTLMQIATQFMNNSLDTSMYYIQQGLSLSERVGYKKGVADAYYQMKGIYYEKNNIPLVFECCQKALKIYDEIGEKELAGRCYFWMGLIHNVQGNYSEALKYYEKAKQYYEKADNKEDLADLAITIGGIYETQGNYPQALNKYLEGIRISKSVLKQSNIYDHNKQALARGYEALGRIYEKQGNYTDALKNEFDGLALCKENKVTLEVTNFYEDIAHTYQLENMYKEALKYALDALNIEKENNYIWGIGTSAYVVGDIYLSQGNYKEALKNFEQALKNAEEAGDKGHIANANVKIATTFEKLGDLKQGLIYGTKGLALVLAEGEKENIKEAYCERAIINSKLANYRDAFNDEVLYKQYYDSIYNKENEKKLTSMQMQYDFDKIQDSARAEQSTKDALTGKEIENQKKIRNYTLGGLGIVLLFLVFVFIQRTRISKEKKRSDELLLNILPAEVAEELKAKGSADAKQFDEVTVMFTDFKGFTSISEKLTAKELVAEIDYCFKGFDNIIHKYNIEKIKTIGDSYMAAGGLPVANKTHAKDVVSAALEIVAFMEEHKQQRTKENKPVFEIRIGINTGPVVAGIVGVKKFAYDIWGDTVNLASRMESSGEPGKVNISGSTYELVKNDFTCTYRGKIQAKNKGEVDMYFIQGC